MQNQSSVADSIQAQSKTWRWHSSKCNGCAHASGACCRHLSAASPNKQPHSQEYPRFPDLNPTCCLALANTRSARVWLNALSISLHSRHSLAKRDVSISVDCAAQADGKAHNGCGASAGGGVHNANMELGGNAALHTYSIQDTSIPCRWDMSTRQATTCTQHCCLNTEPQQQRPTPVTRQTPQTLRTFPSGPQAPWTKPLPLTHGPHPGWSA